MRGPTRAFYNWAHPPKGAEDIEPRIDTTGAIEDALQGAHGLLGHLRDDAGRVSVLEKMAGALADCFEAGGKVLCCGNGGSACDALHFAEEFTGRFRKDRRALPVVPLMEGGHLTCVSNDYGFEEVFARGVEAYGRPGDLLLALSTSGNSPNVIRAVDVAQELKLGVLLFLGREGGRLARRGTLRFIAPGETTDRIQELHMFCLHVLIECVERRLFPENY